MSDSTHRAKTTAASTPGSFAPHTRSESEVGLKHDVAGSVVGAPRHRFPIGAPVSVTRWGVRQPWAVTVFRHDRNLTYRLHAAASDTYVTAHEDELAIDLPDGTLDENYGLRLFDPADIGVRSLGDANRDELNAALEAFDPDNAPEVVEVPIGSIDGVSQSELAREPLDWYLDRSHEDTYDDEVSFFGADGPLAVRIASGELIIVDGCHRYAAAWLNGDETFSLQIITAPQGETAA